MEFQEKLTRLQEAVFAETALLHKSTFIKGIKTLKEIADNKDGQYSEDTVLKSAIELVNCVHRNMEAIKVVEQNRTVIDRLKAEQDEPFSSQGSQEECEL